MSNRCTARLAQGQPVYDRCNARRGPRCSLGEFALIPRLDLAFECHLVIIHHDANGIRFHFCIALQGIHDLSLNIGRRYVRLNLDQIGDPTYPGQFADSGLRREPLILPWDRAR